MCVDVLIEFIIIIIIIIIIIAIVINYHHYCFCCQQNVPIVCYLQVGAENASLKPITDLLPKLKEPVRLFFINADN